MKRLTTLLAISLFLLFSQPMYSQEIASPNKSVNEACVKTLLEGINSGNKGLQAGCAYMLGELSCDKAVIALLNILHSDPKEEMRIVAALSLYKIGDSRGMFAIKQAIKFDKSERVSKLCEGFYKSYLHSKNDELIQIALQ